MFVAPQTTPNVRPFERRRQRLSRSALGCLRISSIEAVTTPCAILIFTVGPFRLGDVVELVDTVDKPGVKGRVVAINLLYTTLIEVEEAGTGGVTVQVPNSLFFQRSVRRWRDSAVLPSER